MGGRGRQRRANPVDGTRNRHKDAQILRRFLGTGHPWTSGVPLPSCSMGTNSWCKSMRTGKAVYVVEGLGEGWRTNLDRLESGGHS